MNVVECSGLCLQYSSGWVLLPQIYLKSSRPMKLKFHFRKGLNSPYEVRWWSKQIRNGEEKYVPQSRFFKSAKERQSWSNSFSKRIERFGTNSLAVNERRLERWVLADRLIGEVDPVEVVLQWKESLAKRTSIRWSEAVGDYLWHLESIRREQYEVNRYRQVLSRFGESVNDPLIGEVDDRVVSEWVNSLPYGLMTKYNYRKYLSAAFSFFIQKKWIEVNPVRATKLPRLITPEPKIASIAQTQRLFSANRESPGVCAMIALGCFGGMRPSAISRIEKREIDPANRGILTPRRKTKKERRQFIQGHSDNLWSWLERAPASAFAPPMPVDLKAAERWRIRCKRRYYHTVSEAARRAGLHPMTKNWARHSFVSYHVAAFQNPGKTAHLISHTDNANVLYESYYGVRDPDGRTVTKAMGLEYFEIIP